MESNLDVNPAFDEWKSSTAEQKESALAKLVPKMQTFAKAICWKRIPDHNSDFDSLANGIAWRAVQRFDRFEGKSKFSTWFYRIVVNECNRYLRDHKERHETLLEEEMPSKAENLDARIDIIAILDSLEEPNYTIFKMMAEGEDREAIASALGISKHAVTCRWSRLQERIRDVLLV